MLKKTKSVFKKMGKKGKAMLCTAIAAMSTCAMAVVASAETTESTPTMKSMLKDAGDTLINSFNDLIQTMIPVIMGVLGSGLVVFGIIALIKLCKKILGKVTG